MTRLVIVLLGVVLLAACATSGPRVSSSINPAVDLSALQTFGFMAPAGTDRPNGVRTPLTLMLQDAAARELTQLGFRQSDNPDVLVNFHITTEERTQIHHVPSVSTMPGLQRGAWRARYSTWGTYETVVTQFTLGTLVIDIVDTRQNVLAWEGVAQKRLGNDVRKINQEMVDEVVAAVFALLEP